MEQQTPDTSRQPSKQTLAIAVGLALVMLLIAIGLVRIGSRPATTVSATLNALDEGNQRFAAGHAKHPDQSRRRRAALAHGQDPRAIVLACSDSRVPPEIVFDVGLGDLFVVRTVGHALDPIATASIAYGVEKLNVPLIIVLGHTGCGSLRDAIDNANTAPADQGVLAPLYAKLMPAVRLAQNQPGDQVTNAIAAHLHLTMGELSTGDTIIGQRIRGAQVRLAGALYDVNTGLVEWVR
ncbi:MAG TPA: hypothetical protein DCZ72_02130 [Armatimonadetes bacterium]|nr:hypothetical protein [Armatimonadota bacterium]